MTTQLNLRPGLINVVKDYTRRFSSSFKYPHITYSGVKTSGIKGEEPLEIPVMRQMQDTEYVDYRIKWESAAFNFMDTYSDLDGLMTAYTWEKATNEWKDTFGVDADDAGVNGSRNSYLHNIGRESRSYTYVLARQGVDYEAAPDFVYARVKWRDQLGETDTYFSGSVLQFAAPMHQQPHPGTGTLGLVVVRHIYVENGDIVMRVDYERVGYPTTPTKHDWDLSAKEYTVSTGTFVATGLECFYYRAYDGEDPELCPPFNEDTEVTRWVDSDNAGGLEGHYLRSAQDRFIANQFSYTGTKTVNDRIYNIYQYSYELDLVQLVAGNFTR